MHRTRSLSLALPIALLPVLAAQSQPSTQASGLAGEYAALVRRAADAGPGSDAADQMRGAFEHFAKLYAGTPEALSARQWLLQQCWWSRDKDGPQNARQHAERIVAEHPKSKNLAALAELQYVLAPEDRAPILEAALKATPHEEVKAALLLALATHDKSASDDAAQIRAGQRLAALKKDHAKLAPRGGLSYAELAGLNLDPVTPAELAIGQPFPEMVGPDQTGKTMRLSDFRGKVTVIVFWGLWCGPCKAMIPHERDLVKELEGKPFALVGVNSDKAADDVCRQMQDLKITWPSFFDGGTRGPLSMRFGIRAFPTIYVLDKKGILRFQNVRGEQMTQAVKKLLDEKD